MAIIEYREEPNRTGFDPKDGTSKQRCARIKIFDALVRVRQEIVCKELPLSISWARQPMPTGPSSVDYFAAYTYGEIFAGIPQGEIIANSIYAERGILPFDMEDKGNCIKYHYLIFKDKTGEIYSTNNVLMPRHNLLLPNIYDDDYLIPYQVIVNQCCSEYELECKSHFFPGWVCKPIAPIATSVQKMSEKARI